jgi:hypothetical protein
MHKVQRLIAASALGLPLLLAGQGMALASHHHDHHGSPHVKQDLRQKIKIAPIAVSGNDAHVNVNHENNQAASATNNNTNAEEEGED